MDGLPPASATWPTATIADPASRALHPGRVKIPAGEDDAPSTGAHLASRSVGVLGGFGAAASSHRSRSGQRRRSQDVKQVSLWLPGAHRGRDRIC